MKKIFLVFSIITLSLASQAQFNKYGYPFYTYYDSKDYNAYDQNWDVIEDQNGFIYVANNNDGILQYDGETWRKIEIENKPAVRALAIDSNNVIFVGCSNDFGYLVPNTEGSLVYNSLRNKFDYKNAEFSYIFKVSIIGDTVFYSSDNYLLFQYNTNEDTVIVSDLPQYTLFTFEANNKLYGSGYLDGLFTYENDTVTATVGGEFYKGKNIFSILSDSNSLKIVTGKQGIFNYNLIDGKSTQLLSDDDNNFLNEFITYSADKTGEEILLATIGSGVIACNKLGVITNVYDQQIGIKDHVCASIKSCRNSIWGALGIGLTRFEYSSPFRYFSKESNLEGYVTDVVKFKNDLFVATEFGLFYLEERKNQSPIFVKIEGIDNQIRAMIKMSPTNCQEKEFLLIGTIEGIYKLDDKHNKVQLIEQNLKGIEKFTELNIEEVENQQKIVTFYVNDLYSPKNSNQLWVGTKSRIGCLEYSEGEWKVTNDVYDIKDGISNIVYDSSKNIWFSTVKSGLMKLDLTKKIISKFDEERGLPIKHNIKPYMSSRGLLCGTPLGIFKYDEKQDFFNKDTLFPASYFDETFGVSEMVEDVNGNFYLNFYSNENTGIKKVFWIDDHYEVNECFNRLGNKEANFFYEDDSHIWIGIADILFNYNTTINYNYNQPYKCLVRKVEGLDSAYFFGSYFQETPRGIKSSNIQHEKQKPVLEYLHNDITFHYAATFYEGAEAIKYSYQLKGFKKEWSKWHAESKAVFTNLNEGQYTFKVKAKNIYNIESSEGEYSFTILPPWYRTILAYLMYIILALLSVWVIVKMYTQRLKQEKIRLEGIVRERTAEIREQRDEISDQKKSIEDSILYARRIQRAILPSDEFAEEILPEHFILFRPRDIVSGDYFWMNKIGHLTIIVAADCTGHGVPGAFMSMLGVSFLNEIVLKDNIVEPHKILNKLRDRVKKTLKQEGKDGEAKDGMDVAVIVIDEKKRKLNFAGAYNPVYIFRGSELIEIKADRMPIGIYIKERESFTLNEFDYDKGDTFYIFSDGYPDQFGGAKGQKFRSKALKGLLASIQDKSMAEQNEILNKTIIDWMGEDNEQIDDMVIVGVRM